MKLNVPLGAELFTGPLPRARRDSAATTAPTLPVAKRKRAWTKPVLAICVVAAAITAIGKDLYDPTMRTYMADRFWSPSLHFSKVSATAKDASGTSHAVLAVAGQIGPAAITAFNSAADAAHLGSGDLVLIQSNGGDLSQGMLLGEAIRRRGLITAVGTPGPNGEWRPGYCASACVLAFAGGVYRMGVPGSKIGIHRFRVEGNVLDPLADAQATMGRVLGFATRMGVSASFLEAASAVDASGIRWLTPEEAVGMNLVTNP